MNIVELLTALNGFCLVTGNLFNEVKSDKSELVWKRTSEVASCKMQYAGTGNLNLRLIIKGECVAPNGEKREANIMRYLPLVKEGAIVNRDIITTDGEVVSLTEVEVRDIDLDECFRMNCEAFLIKAGNKVANAKAKALNEDTKVSNFWTENGLNGGWFSPKTDYVKVKPAHGVKVSIKSCSSLPKISDVEAKIADNKSLTLSESILHDAMLGKIKGGDEDGIKARCDEMAFNLALGEKKKVDFTDVEVGEYKFSGSIEVF